MTILIFSENFQLSRIKIKEVKKTFFPVPPLQHFYLFHFRSRQLAAFMGHHQAAAAAAAAHAHAAQAAQAAQAAAISSTGSPSSTTTTTTSPNLPATSVASPGN